MKKWIKKADVLLICVLLLAALLFFVWKSSGSPAQTAEIICDEQTLMTIDLQAVDEPYRMTLPNGMVLAIEKGKIEVCESGCADKLCIQCGALTKDGDTAVCLPNRTLIKVTGEKQNTSPDIISY